MSFDIQDGRDVDLVNDVARLSALVEELSRKLEAIDMRVAERSLIGVGYTSLKTFDSGDIAWMMSATTLVLMMTLPGLSLYYAGMSPRKENMMTTAMEAFSTAGLITLMWMFFGYSLTFETSSPVIGSARSFWLAKLNYDGYDPIAGSIPETLHCVFQLSFAIVAAALMLGSSGDRIKYFSMLFFVCIWHLIVYCPIAHANWARDGFLYKAEVLDFAGGNVVHISAGMSGLASSYVLGKRHGFGTKSFAPQNILYTITGACMLWIGWCGFNGGSAYGANEQAASALLMTQIATAAASFSWMMMDYLISKKLTVIGLLCGAVAGLVAITPGAGYVDANGAFFIGLISGPVCYGGIRLKHNLGFDDSLDAFGLHGIAGFYGGFMTGLFANKFGATGAFYGNGRQLGVQIYGIVVCSGYSFLVTLILLMLMDLSWGIRVSSAAEKRGLDRSNHGEGLYVAKPDDKTPEERVADLLRSYAEATNTPVPKFLGMLENSSDDDDVDGGGSGESASYRKRNNLDTSPASTLGMTVLSPDIENPQVLEEISPGISAPPPTLTRTVRNVPSEGMIINDREQLAALMTLANKSISGKRSGTSTPSESTKLDKAGCEGSNSHSNTDVHSSNGTTPHQSSSMTNLATTRHGTTSPPKMSRKNKSVSFSVDEGEAKGADHMMELVRDRLMAGLSKEVHKEQDEIDSALESAMKSTEKRMKDETVHSSSPFAGPEEMNKSNTVTVTTMPPEGRGTTHIWETEEHHESAIKVERRSSSDDELAPTFD